MVNIKWTWYRIVFKANFLGIKCSLLSEYSTTCYSMNNKLSELSLVESECECCARRTNPGSLSGSQTAVLVSFVLYWNLSKGFNFKMKNICNRMIKIILTINPYREITFLDLLILTKLHIAALNLPHANCSHRTTHMNNTWIP